MIHIESINQSLNQEKRESQHYHSSPSPKVNKQTTSIPPTCAPFDATTASHSPIITPQHGHAVGTTARFNSSPTHANAQATKIMKRRTSETRNMFGRKQVLGLLTVHQIMVRGQPSGQDPGSAHSARGECTRARGLGTQFRGYEREREGWKGCIYIWLVWSEAINAGYS